MNTFAKNIFVDSNGLIKILKIANEQQGGTLSREQLSHFTEQVKRSRQTLDDWLLYSSLQDGSILPKINEIKNNQSQLIKLSLPCLKEPSKLSSTLPVILQTFYNISRILFSILRDQATDVEGLLDVIKISEGRNQLFLPFSFIYLLYSQFYSILPWILTFLKYSQFYVFNTPPSNQNPTFGRIIFIFFGFFSTLKKLLFFWKYLTTN